MAARASTRISIRWPPAPASEPTHTLVLSLGGYYVDLRVSKEDQSIDWALAGQRIVVSEDPLKIEFTHPLDSHHPNNEADDVSAAPDLGEFTKLPNGDDLETGEMAAPHLGGKVMPYEEVWRQLDPSIHGDDTNSESADGSSEVTAWILESVDEEDPAKNTAELTTKSFYARIGRFYLAIRQMRAASSDPNQEKSSGGETGTTSFAALWQELDAQSMTWETKHAIGDVARMLRMDTDGFETDVNEGTWKKDARVMVRSGEQHQETQESCIVRAVAHSTSAT